MAISQLRSKRKISGGRYKKQSKKLKNQGSLPTHTKLDESSTKEKRVRSGLLKSSLLSCNTVNVVDPKNKKAHVTEILTVVSNEANRHFIRRNIITKGTVVETKIGKVKITSRPGQEGSLQGVLLA